MGFNLVCLFYGFKRAKANFRVLNQVLDRVQRLRDFRDSVRLQRAQATFQQNKVVLGVASTVVLIYYAYELLFHAAAEVLLDGSPRFYREMVEVAHDICDILGLLILASILDKRFYFNTDYCIAVLIPFATLRGRRRRFAPPQEFDFSFLLE